jgi:hypothetical protein
MEVPARMSVARAQDASHRRLFQLPVARAIAAQLILFNTLKELSTVVGNQELPIPKRNLYLASTPLVTDSLVLSF